VCHTALMPFYKPGDPKARERVKQERRERKEQRRVLTNDPRFQAMKKAAKERQRAAYAKAKEQQGSAYAEAKKRQRAAYAKAKEHRKELLVEQKKLRREREAAEQAARDAALMRRLVRPAAGLASREEGAASTLERLLLKAKRRRTAGRREMKLPECSPPRPVQLALATLNSREE